MVTNRDVEALEVEYEALDPFDDPLTLFIPDVSDFSPVSVLMTLTLPTVESASRL